MKDPNERFADIELLRYEVKHFDTLPLERQLFVYHLSEACLWGRDILFDQHHRFNLCVKAILSELISTTELRKDKEYEALEEYFKRFMFASGAHHHYSEKKFQARFSSESLRKWIETYCSKNLKEQMAEAQISLNAVIDYVTEPTTDSVRTVSHGEGDLLKASAINFYDDKISLKEAQTFYREHGVQDPTLSLGLQSKLRKDENDKLYEDIYCLKGRYAVAIRELCTELKIARLYTDNEHEQKLIDELLHFYKTGDLTAYKDYCIEWLKHDPSKTAVDFINGFTETYQDPLGRTGTWEGLVQVHNPEASERTQRIVQEAQWFEDNSPTDPKHKKEKVVGVQASVVEAAMLGGDCYPAAPLGINLPNNESIREQWGSKSVRLSNISDSVHARNYEGETYPLFFKDPEVLASIRKWGAITDDLHTDLHECLGHGSGRLLPGVSENALGEYDSTIEEARADLFALYFIADPKMQEMDILPKDAWHAQYDLYICNGAIMQLDRLDKGDKIEEAHMRNRALIAHYVLEHCEPSVAKMEKENDDYYICIKDYEGLRKVIGELLREIQKIKSEGLYENAKTLIQRYAIEVDPDIHASAKRRYERFHPAPFKGFINPKMEIQHRPDGVPSHVKLNYEETFIEQVQRYNNTYSCLPLNNDLDGNTAKGIVVAEGPWHESMKSLRRRLHRAMDGVVADSMREGGMLFKSNFGVTLGRLEKMSEEIHSGFNDADKLKQFAEKLWTKKEAREFRLLAIFLLQDAQTSWEEVLRFLVEAETLEELEQLCLKRIVRQPFAYPLAEWLLKCHINDDLLSSCPFILLAQRIRLVNDDVPQSLKLVLQESLKETLQTEKVSFQKLLFWMRAVECLCTQDLNYGDLLLDTMAAIPQEQIRQDGLAGEIRSTIEYLKEEV